MGLPASHPSLPPRKPPAPAHHNRPTSNLDIAPEQPNLARTYTLLGIKVLTRSSPEAENLSQAAVFPSRQQRNRAAGSELRL